MKILVPLCLLTSSSFSQMNYDHYLPFYDSLGVPKYMKLSDTAKYFNYIKTMPGSSIDIFDDNEKIAGYYVLESKRKWVFMKK